MTTTTRHDPATAPETKDPLRLCVYTTIALLTWGLGPVVVVAFAVMGFAAYRAARRGGLLQSKCVLRDTRLVLTYLSLAVLAGTAGVVLQVVRLLD